MEYGFRSQKELFQRVKPALNSKCMELQRYDLDVKELDIWNYLIIKKWKKAQGLMLSDVVNDIMSLKASDISNYLKEKEHYLDII